MDAPSSFIFNESLLASEADRRRCVCVCNAIYSIAFTAVITRGDVELHFALTPYFSPIRVASCVARVVGHALVICCKTTRIWFSDA
jgi:hypothetical protein